jgi:deoxyribodipyrimidine photo-lyase
MPKLDKGLFIFHRDFRIKDNIGLIELSKLVNKLYVCFIFTPEQVTEKNKYRSINSIQFMIESLEDLEADIQKNNGKLMFFYGETNSIIKSIMRNMEIDIVAFNKDYTPYALKRDNDIIELCKSEKKQCNTYSDYYLYEPGTIKTDTSNVAYKKYTPFYRAVLDKNVDMPNNKKISNFSKPRDLLENTTLSDMYKKYAADNQEILVRGGRKNGIEKLSKAVNNQLEYDEKRDFFKEKTTHLSAYIKFGCVSIREVYHSFKNKFGVEHGLIREIIWREFFAHVLYAYPEVVGQSYQPKYRNLKWENKKEYFNKWKKGETGVPLVDACMREMNSTGYMHNRGRMTVASFLIKSLLIDWRWGEKYFATQLTDYDLASNNGNWQGISGTGVDMKPYFRDMNPWLQSKKFDNDTSYIKKWVPELQSVKPSDIHEWHTTYKKYTDVKYPPPIVDYFKRKDKMISMYKKT